MSANEKTMQLLRRGMFAMTFLSAAAFALPLAAKVELATPFADGMVLQRGRDVPVWGKAAPGSKVVVSFAGATVATTVGADGAWSVKLPPMAASKESRVLRVSECEPGFFWDSETDAAEVKDVLVGEVWMCAGQSNTDCPIWSGSPRYRDGWGAMTLLSTDKPFVRLVKTPLVASAEPRYGYRVEWMKMTPALFDAWKKKARMPSAMGYYFALELANALDIPVGLVDSSWGGTNIDAWTPRSGYEGLADLDVERNWKNVPKGEWKDEMRKGPISGWIQQPSALWNSMVAAYAPMACRGLIWYQGCHNSWEYRRYANKMHALYNGWSKEFANPGMKLYFVQLAPWGNGDIANIQMAQAQFEKEEPNAAMAVINDVGNLKDIHPNDKRTVAKRLALHALRRDYGRASIRDNSPTIKTWKVKDGAFVLSFNDAEGWYVYNPDRSTAVGFEVCGADGVWKPAKIRNFITWKNGKGELCNDGQVAGSDLVVAADEVKNPVKLRYLHSAPWFGALYNEACLPLGAFAIEAK